MTVFCCTSDSRPACLRSSHGGLGLRVTTSLFPAVGGDIIPAGGRESARCVGALPSRPAPSVLWLAGEGGVCR